MSERSYAPPLGINGPLGPIDPDAAGAFDLALRMHAGRFRAIPRFINQPVPGSGTSFNIKGPDVGRVWLLKQIRINIITSAAVANRFSILEHSDGTQVTGFSTTQTSLLASNLGNVCFNETAASAFGGSGLYQVAPLPVKALYGANLLKFTLLNGDVGDAIGAIFIHAVELQERTPNERATYVKDLYEGRMDDDYPGLSPYF